jgi:hypothetical protein
MKFFFQEKLLRRLVKREARPTASDQKGLGKRVLVQPWTAAHLVD